MPVEPTLEKLLTSIDSLELEHQFMRRSQQALCAAANQLPFAAPEAQGVRQECARAKQAADAVGVRLDELRLQVLEEFENMWINVSQALGDVRQEIENGLAELDRIGETYSKLGEIWALVEREKDAWKAHREKIKELEADETEDDAEDPDA